MRAGKLLQGWGLPVHRRTQRPIHHVLGHPPDLPGPPLLRCYSGLPCWGLGRAGCSCGACQCACCSCSVPQLCVHGICTSGRHKLHLAAPAHLLGSLAPAGGQASWLQVPVLTALLRRCCTPCSATRPAPTSASHSTSSPGAATWQQVRLLAASPAAAATAHLGHQPALLCSPI